MKKNKDKFIIVGVFITVLLVGIWLGNNTQDDQTDIELPNDRTILIYFTESDINKDYLDTYNQIVNYLSLTLEDNGYRVVVGSDLEYQEYELLIYVTIDENLDGVITYYQNTIDGSGILAGLVQDYTSTKTYAKNLGIEIKELNLGNKVSCQLNLGLINLNSEHYLRDEKYIESIALAITNGINEYFEGQIV